jgi:hypothetical protein
MQCQAPVEFLSETRVFSKIHVSKSDISLHYFDEFPYPFFSNAVIPEVYTTNVNVIPESKSQLTSEDIRVVVVTEDYLLHAQLVLLIGW